jgi:hypothetical protein
MYTGCPMWHPLFLLYPANAARHANHLPPFIWAVVASVCKYIFNRINCFGEIAVLNQYQHVADYFRVTRYYRHRYPV